METISQEMAAALEVEKTLSIGRPPAADITLERKRRIALSRYWTVGSPWLDEVWDHAVSAADGTDINVRIYHPDRTALLPIIALIHGGGWAYGSIQEVEALARHLAFHVHAVVVSINYRLAPEHPYPTGLNDCMTVLDWLAANGERIGGNPAHVAMVGESAGANLATAAALQYRGGNLQALALFYGVLQHSFDTESYRNLGDGRFGLTRDRMIALFEQYVPSHIERGQASISPVHGEVGSLPPVWLCAAECDPLRDDTLMFARCLRQTRTGDQCLVVPGVVHMFINRVRLLPAAKATIDSASLFLKQHL
jgi:acetyl esterase